MNGVSVEEEEEEEEETALIFLLFLSLSNSMYCTVQWNLDMRCSELSTHWISSLQ